MITVELKGMEIFAHHGFYPEEQILGNRFVIDVAVDFDPLDKIVQDKIANTVNYEQLRKIVADEMQLTKKLLETVVQNIMDQINKEFTFIIAARVSIKKLNPLMPGKMAYSAVTITYNKHINEI